MNVFLNRQREICTARFFTICKALNEKYSMSREHGMNSSLFPFLSARIAQGSVSSSADVKQRYLQQVYFHLP